MSLDILLPLCLVLGAGGGWLVLKMRQRIEEASDEKKTKPKDSQRPEASDELSSALVLELTAAMLRAGSSLAEACQTLVVLAQGKNRDTLFEVSRGLSHGLAWKPAWERAEVVIESRTPPSLTPLRDCLESLADQGAPTADLLDIVAERHRRLEQRRAEKQAAKLSVKLVVPLGLCSLPAFICWGVIPVMIALLPGLTDTF